MIRSVLAAFAVVVLMAGCGGPKPEVPKQSAAKKPDTSNIEINGDASDPVTSWPSSRSPTCRTSGARTSRTFTARTTNR